MVKEIPLTRGLVALVDDEDYERLSSRLWYAYRGANTWYAGRNKPSPKRGTLPMHRAIIDAPEGMFVDHIDGNGLNNTRGNLRIATRGQNNCNRRTTLDNKTGYKGVVQRRGRGKLYNKWQASITVNKKTVGLGTYDSPEDAARAYDTAARKYHGEFARPNFDENGSRIKHETIGKRTGKNSVRLVSTNTTGFRGVIENNGKWIARLQAHGVGRHLGTYLTARDAALAYDVAARHHFGSSAILNFPDSNEVSPLPIVTNAASGYRGVVKHQAFGWKAEISINRKTIHLGIFGTPEDAAAAYDQAARKQWGVKAKTNFAEAIDPMNRITETPKHTYYGVYPMKSGKWKARIQIEGKGVHIGYFDTPEAAARAWDAAAIKYRGKGTRTNFPQPDEDEGG